MERQENFLGHEWILLLKNAEELSQTTVPLNATNMIHFPQEEIEFIRKERFQLTYNKTKS
jgi:hypothetical protein